MYTSYSESIKDDQMNEIGHIRKYLTNIFKRNITISETIIHWIALAAAEETINSHYYE